MIHHLKAEDFGAIVERCLILLSGSVDEHGLKTFLRGDHEMLCHALLAALRSVVSEEIVVDGFDELIRPTIRQSSVFAAIERAVYPERFRHE